MVWTLSKTGRVSSRFAPPITTLTHMDRPKAYAEHRFIGDKRTQLVYDLDAEYEPETIDELVGSEQVATFGPDTLPEARNRGYRLAKR